MKKYTVNMTMTTILTASVQIEANSLQEAMVQALDDADTSEWTEKTELKASSK